MNDELNPDSSALGPERNGSNGNNRRSGQGAKSWKPSEEKRLEQHV